MYRATGLQQDVPPRSSFRDTSRTRSWGTQNACGTGQGMPRQKCLPNCARALLLRGRPHQKQGPTSQKPAAYMHSLNTNPAQAPPVAVGRIGSMTLPAQMPWLVRLRAGCCGGLLQARRDGSGVHGLRRILIGRGRLLLRLCRGIPALLLPWGVASSAEGRQRCGGRVAVDDHDAARHVVAACARGQAPQSFAWSWLAQAAWTRRRKGGEQSG